MPPDPDEVRVRAAMELLETRFGFAPETWAPYRVVFQAPHTLRLAAADHQPPDAPKALARGLALMRLDQPYPKLTTEAAMLLGPHARRCCVSLGAAQAEAYLRRRPVDASAAQCRACSSAGYVLVSAAGVWLGVGFYHAEEGRHRIDSLYPKAYALKGPTR